MNAWSLARTLRWSGSLALLAALLLSAAIASRPVAAQSPPDDGCNPDEPVACIPLPDEEEPEPPAEQPSGAPAPATASPRVPQPPLPCPAFAAAEPGVAAPSRPAPPLCDRRAVVATVNRANALYARALRTLNTSELPSAWSGQALAQVEGWVVTLRDSGRYATPELRSIALEELRVSGGNAHVRTLENWLYEERTRLSGQVLLRENQWVVNLYDLRLERGGWRVVRNDVYTVPAPLPPPPPSVPEPTPPPVPPSPPPCILIYPPPPGCEPSSLGDLSLEVTTDQSVYRPGETVTATVTNTGSVAAVGGGGYVCGLVAVEVARGSGWERAPGGAEICTAIGIVLRPGESRTEQFSAGGPGVYRLRVSVTADRGGGRATVYSEPYSVVP